MDISCLFHSCIFVSYVRIMVVRLLNFDHDFGHSKTVSSETNTGPNGLVRFLYQLGRWRRVTIFRGAGNLWRKVTIFDSLKQTFPKRKGSSPNKTMAFRCFLAVSFREANQISVAILQFWPEVRSINFSDLRICP